MFGVGVLWAAPVKKAKALRGVVLSRYHAHLHMKHASGSALPKGHALFIHRICLTSISTDMRKERESDKHSSRLGRLIGS